MKTFEIFITVFPTIPAKAPQTLYHFLFLPFIPLFFCRLIAMSSTHAATVFRDSRMCLLDSSLDVDLLLKRSLMANSA